MALYMPGFSKCPICAGTINEEDAKFGTWGVFSDCRDLRRFCDAVMHWSCYADWPRRREFAQAYFDFWVANESHNKYWAKVYLDDRVLVIVNPFVGQNGQAELVLAVTGSRVRVQMEDWERWLDGSETEASLSLHSLEVAELRAITPMLKTVIPTVTDVMHAIDCDSKGWTRESYLP